MLLVLARDKRTIWQRTPRTACTELHLNIHWIFWSVLSVLGKNPSDPFIHSLWVFNLQDFCPGWREHRRTHPTVPVQNSPSAHDIIRIMFLQKSKMMLMRMTLVLEGHRWILGGVWILGNPSANVALSPPIPLTRSHPDSLLKHFIHIFILSRSARESCSSCSIHPIISW